MIRIAVLGALLLGAQGAWAQSSEALDSGTTDAQEQLAELTDQTAQRVSELEARVQALEAQPAARADARNTRADRAREIMASLVALEQTLSLGQNDVSASLKETHDALSALTDAAVAEGSRTEAQRATEALQAVTYALDAVGRSDLFQARSALSNAVLSLAVARDLATAG